MRASARPGRSRATPGALLCALALGLALSPTSRGEDSPGEALAEICGRLPSQSHAMMDVDYHFSNLWFAGQAGNWPLAAFYLNETRSHLNWAVRLRPVRRLGQGGSLELKPLLEAVEASGLSALEAAITQRSRDAFEAAYKGTLQQCYGCHAAAEKPYLRLAIPQAPASRMIDMQPR